MNTMGKSPDKGGLKSLFERLVVGMNTVGSAWIFVLMVLINLDVFARFLFDAPIDGVPEMVELSIVGIVFLQLGDSVRAGRLIRSDGLYNRITAKWPAVGHVMGLLFDLAGAIFLSLIATGAWQRFIEAYEKDYFIGTQGLFTAPLWPVRLIVVLGCVVIVIMFGIFAANHAKALMYIGEPKS